MTRALAAGLATTLAAHAAHADDLVLYLHEQGAPSHPPPGAVTPEAPVSEVSTHAARARDALRTAREQFLAFAFHDAARALDVVAADAIDHLVGPETPLALALLHWAGACALLAGETDVAERDFRRALAIAPDARLPTLVFPAEVESRFEELRHAVALAGPTACTVRTVPSGARVEVDGRDEGVTPVTVRLAQGVHSLRLERVGYRRWLGPLRVEGADALAQQFELTEADGPTLRQSLGRATGLATVPDAATLARIRAEYHAARVVISLRDGSELVHPPTTPSALPWILAGVAVGAAALGVGLYFVLRPPPTITFSASGS